MLPIDISSRFCKCTTSIPFCSQIAELSNLKLLTWSLSSVWIIFNSLTLICICKITLLSTIKLLQVITTPTLRMYSKVIQIQYLDRVGRQILITLFNHLCKKHLFTISAVQINNKLIFTKVVFIKVLEWWHHVALYKLWAHTELWITCKM